MEINKCSICGEKPISHWGTKSSFIHCKCTKLIEPSELPILVKSWNKLNSKCPSDTPAEEM